MTHTPGPWLIESKVYVCGGECCVAVTETYSAMQKLSPEQREANARLIAAAPELLEACQEFVKHIKSLGTDTEKCRYLSMALNCRAGDLIENAIAKATGE
jgi:hypothetical protein